MDIAADTAAWVRRLKRAPIVTPGPDQYVDRCHYSKTGWAVWDKDGACTCKPAKAPPQTDSREG